MHCMTVSMRHLCCFCGRTHSHIIPDVIIYCVKDVQIISFCIFFLQKKILCVKYIEHLFLQIFFSHLSKELGKLEIEVMLFNSIKLCHLFTPLTGIGTNSSPRTCLIFFHPQCTLARFFFSLLKSIMGS